MADIAEKDDEIESLKTVSAAETAILTDQLQQKQHEHKRRERDMEESHAEALADAQVAEQRAREELDRVSAARATDRAKHTGEKQKILEALQVAQTERNEPYYLANELEKWLVTTQAMLLLLVVTDCL